jgi:pimeloyl-ACP methyl ester carboxylesterase
MLKSMLTFIALLAGTFLVLCLFMYVRQDSFLFFPLQNDPSLLRQWEQQRVEIASGDGTIEGWWLDAAPSSTGKIILYFGGNAEDVLYTAATSQRLHARRVLVTNYRGYGASQGKPSQAALYQDALAIYDYAVQHTGIRPEDIIVMGRSLGSGVATYLAAHRPVRAAVLITPFDSISAVAQYHYRFLPVGILLRHPFPSDTFAPKITAPVLIVAGELDQVIAARHAERLFAAWAGEKKIHVLSGAGHNDIDQHPDYYRLVNEFLESLVS